MFHSGIEDPGPPTLRASSTDGGVEPERFLVVGIVVEADIAEGESARRIDQCPIERQAGAKPCGPEPIDLDAIVRPKENIPAAAVAIDARPLEVTFDAEHQKADLVVGTDLRSGERTAQSKIISVAEEVEATIENVAAAVALSTLEPDTSGKAPAGIHTGIKARPREACFLDDHWIDWSDGFEDVSRKGRAAHEP
jgi:hypothetical protein